MEKNSTQPAKKDTTKKNKKNLKEGFTTGTASSAAAGAAAWALFYHKQLKEYPTLVPPFTLKKEEVFKEQNHFVYIPANEKRLTIPIHKVHCENLEDGTFIASATVVKDGGDDPDVTHNAKIEAKVFLFELDLKATPAENLDKIQQKAEKNGAKSRPICLENNIFLFAGTGVGIASLPGLPIEVGEPAINPDPRMQIAATLSEVRDSFFTNDKAQDNQREHQEAFSSLVAIISVENGEQIATKTLNPKLGIVGGISILGTRGTVKPFSHEAWEHSIIQALKVNKALGAETVVLCTGRRSEELIQKKYPELIPQAFIQAADYVGSALKESASQGFKKIVWACFWGKLVKLAQGFENTHAHRNNLELNFLTDKLSSIIKEPINSPDEMACKQDLKILEQKIKTANTAREALVYIKESNQDIAKRLIEFVGSSAFNHASKIIFSEKNKNNLALNFELICFDFDGTVLFQQEKSFMN
ncbi:cobalt-precorrin-5B (C(1))-methyltransferase CbiD [Desulfovibrio litoralis]|uniref:Cobalt-precorrin-5B C(1)-methyltransferase n=1 Tax=Desulfovibrio litoralis DSM 11393 TaxID=1121455 RepID=A0A1M7T697_9BACT|nr:cobalt-precorrin-5B (C(1))-methyltransferase CbiD [Desulfovibrio litoralis]SHN66281.1 cobalt-precorrin-5B (C1)-methyltransferase [Desulfovibrio litoralis DSM 11393]